MKKTSVKIKLFLAMGFAAVLMIRSGSIHAFADETYENRPLSEFAESPEFDTSVYISRISLPRIERVGVQTFVSDSGIGRGGYT